jgi:hypothetical protein
MSSRKEKKIQEINNYIATKLNPLMEGLIDSVLRA